MVGLKAKRPKEPIQVTRRLPARTRPQLLMATRTPAQPWPPALKDWQLIDRKWDSGEISGDKRSLFTLTHISLPFEQQ